MTLYLRITMAIDFFKLFRTKQVLPEPIQQRGVQEYMTYMTGIGLTGIKDVNVSPKTALAIGVVYECIEAITNTLSLVTPKVIELTARGKYPAYNHPVYPLVSIEPHPLYDAAKYYETMTVHLLLWGNAYAYIHRNITGIPISLEILYPYDVEVEILEIDGIKERWYKYKDGPVYNQKDIIHLADFSIELEKGISRITAKKNTLREVGSVANYTKDIYTNGLQISGLVTGTSIMGSQELEYFRQKIQEKYGNTSGQIMALPPGFKFEQFKHNLPFADAQVIEAKKFGVEDVARIFGVPLSMIGRGDSADNKSDREYNTFLTTTIAPITLMIENEHNRKLFNGRDLGRYYMKFELKGIYRVDMLTRYQAHQIALNQGFMNKDEVRDIENMNPIPDGLGQAYYQQLNTIPLDQAEDYFKELIKDKTTKSVANDTTGA